MSLPRSSHDTPAQSTAKHLAKRGEVHAVDELLMLEPLLPQLWSLVSIPVPGEDGFLPVCTRTVFGRLRYGRESARPKDRGKKIPCRVPISACVRMQQNPSRLSAPQDHPSP